MISRIQMVCLAILLLIDVVASVGGAMMLPSRVPMHWNFHGQIDRYGSPWEMVWFGPPVTIFIAAVMTGLPLISKVRTTLARSGAMYGRITIGIVGTMVALHLVLGFLMVQNFAAGHAPADTSAAFPDRILAGVFIVLGVLLVILGNWMGKLRRNSVMGIRTPWTLKSDFVWERTHRVGGRLMVAHGLAVMLAGYFLPFWAAIAVVMGGALALCVWAFIYSKSLAQAEQATASTTHNAP